MPSSSGPSPPATNPAPGSRSPIAPPYSPITPVLRTAALPSIAASTASIAASTTTTGGAPPSTTASTVAPSDADPPPPRAPVPIAESTNPDAIALRAALSALQIQRLRAADALRVLQRQRRAALAEPRRFARALGRGRIRSAEEVMGMTTQVRRDAVGGKRVRRARGAGGNAADVAVTSEEGSGESEEEDEDEDGEDEEDTPGDDDDEDGRALARFGDIPGPQAVVRCPPVNWAKYHVAGAALDRLHREQRRWPDAGQPMGAAATGVGRDGAAKEGRRAHVLAAPYSPWRDEVPSAAARRRPGR